MSLPVLKVRHQCPCTLAAFQKILRAQHGKTDWLAEPVIYTVDEIDTLAALRPSQPHWKYMSSIQHAHTSYLSHAMQLRELCFRRYRTGQDRGVVISDTFHEKGHF